MEDLERPRLRPLQAFPWEGDGRRMICIRDPEGISPHVATLSPDIAPFLFEVLDGEHTLTDIQAEYARRSGGQLLMKEDLLALLRQLDAALFLETEAYRRRLAELLEEYRVAPARPARLAGDGYPDDPGELATFLDGFYEGVRDEGPADGLSAVAVPHLDLRSGGPAAARGLAGLADSFAGDTVVVLGVGHQLGRLPYALTSKDFETPFGTVPVDRDLLDRVVGAAGSWVLEEEFAHLCEHSVEFAAVLLRHALPDREFRILPVLCGSFHGFLLNGSDPAEDPLVGSFLETLAEEAGDALLYSSVDLAHMGPYYGDAQALTRARLEWIEQEDRKMLDLMTARDAAGFLAHLRDGQDARRVCGLSAIYTQLSLLPAGPPGRLLAYEQPVFPTDGNTVSICAMRWER